MSEETMRYQKKTVYFAKNFAKTRVSNGVKCFFFGNYLDIINYFYTNYFKTEILNFLTKEKENSYIILLVCKSK